MKIFTIMMNLLPSFLLLFLFIYSRTIESSSEEEGISQCNPTTKHLFGKFFLQRYFDARDELGMENLKVKYLQRPSEFAKMSEYVLVKFFSWSGGSLIYYRRNHEPIIYARIWKCANEGIGMNLHVLTAGAGATLSEALVHEAKTYESLQEILHTMHRKDFLNSTTANVFTFVREPFSKFISGFAEAVFRTGPGMRLRRSSEPPMVINYTFAKTIIERVFDREIPILQIDHFFPLSGALFEFPMRAIGHLESLKEDWDAIIRPLYSIDAEYNLLYGYHPTSEIHPRSKKSKGNRNPNINSKHGSNAESNAVADPGNVRPNLRLLFSKEVKYKRAICHLLLIDYVCLPEYPLPSDCLFLNETMHRARQALHRKQEIPIH